jgi:hypothetical protein
MVLQNVRRLNMSDGVVFQNFSEGPDVYKGVGKYLFPVVPPFRLNPSRYLQIVLLCIVRMLSISRNVKLNDSQFSQKLLVLCLILGHCGTISSSGGSVSTFRL